MSARSWISAKIAAFGIAQTACPCYSVSVVNEQDAWIVCHIGIVLDAGSPTAMNAHTSIMSSGVRFVTTNIVMIAVSRITIMESLIARDVEDCYCLESCMKRKLFLERTRC